MTIPHGSRPTSQRMLVATILQVVVVWLSFSASSDTREGSLSPPYQGNQWNSAESKLTTALSDRNRCMYMNWPHLHFDYGAE
jgi:hypothetical protein